MSRRRIGVVSPVPVALFVALASVVPASSQAPQQSAAPQRFSVTITQVIPSQLEAFIAHVRTDGIPAEKKAGLAWRSTYREVFGDLHTITTVRPLTSLADFDRPSPLSRVIGEQAAAKYLARQRQFVSSQKRLVVTLAPELSISSGSTTPAELLMVTDRKVLPGRNLDYNRLITSQVLPAYRKIGLKDYWVHNVMFGEPIHRVIVRPIANVAELDVVQGQGLLAKALGPDAAAKLQAELSGMTESVETKVLRLIPELSFSNPPQSTSR